MAGNQIAYEKVTAAIITALEQGVVPWQKPWNGLVPMNAETHRPYRGINTILLGCSAFKDVRWITFKGVERLKGSVKKGSKASPVVLWQMREKKDGNGDVISRYPMLRYFSVFNVEQCEGLKLKPLEELIPTGNHNPIDAAEAIVANMQKRPTIEHGHQAAWYRPSSDVVGMPDRQQFHEAAGYYSTLFHELGHSTGHTSRLKREGVVNATFFGSNEYSREELVAEFTAAFLCNHAGVDSTRDQSAAYLASWLKAFKGDTQMAVWAAGKAAAAADYILGKSRDDDEPTLTQKEEQEAGLLAIA